MFGGSGTLHDLTLLFRGTTVVSATMQHAESHPHGWIVVLTRMVACVPTCLILAIVIPAAYIRMSLGRWPVVYFDSDAAPFAALASNVAAFAMVVVLPSVLLLPSVALIRSAFSARPAFGRWAACFAMTWLLAIAIIIYDPTGFLDWVMD